MNILLCSDVREELEPFSQGLQHMLLDKGVEPLVFSFRGTEDVCEYLSVSPDIPDALVVSVREPGGVVMEHLQALSDAYGDMSIILLGRDAGNVERLFSMGVAYFLYTPVSEGSFAGFARRMEKRWFSGRERHLILESKKSTLCIDFSDILYIMSDKRKVIVYQPHGRTDSLYCKLDDMERRLDERFIRCHQSYLVNSQYIRGIDIDSFLLVDDVMIPISQKKYWAAKRQYIQQIKRRG